MKLIKWSLFFIISFFVSWGIIATFSQEPFRQAVPVRIIFYTSKNLPIYYYIASAFFLGLFIGLAIALYNYIHLKAQLFSKGRQIRKLEDRAAENDAAQQAARPRVEGEERELPAGEFDKG